MHIAILETGRINAEIADRFPRYPHMFRSLFGRQQDSGLVFSEVAVIDGEFPASVEDYDGYICLLYTSPSPRDLAVSRMPSSA